MSGYTIAQKAKAVAAFVGSILTALLGYLTAHSAAVLDYEIGSLSVGYLLTAVAAIATYVATFRIPNAPTEDLPASDAEVEGTH